MLSTKWPHPVVEIMAGLGQFGPPLDSRDHPVTVGNLQDQAGMPLAAADSLRQARDDLADDRAHRTGGLIAFAATPPSPSTLRLVRSRLPWTVTKAWPGTGQIPSNGR